MQDCDNNYTSKIEFASFMARLIAFTIDNAILAFVTILLLLPFPYFEDSTQVLIQRTLTTLLLISITLYMWVKFDGATPGKKIMNIKIVNAHDLEGITFKQALKRYVGYIISSIPMLLGFAMMFFTKNKQTLHDKISNTIVIQA